MSKGTNILLYKLIMLTYLTINCTLFFIAIVICKIFIRNIFERGYKSFA